MLLAAFFVFIAPPGAVRSEREPVGLCRIGAKDLDHKVCISITVHIADDALEIATIRRAKFPCGAAEVSTADKGKGVVLFSGAVSVDPVQSDDIEIVAREIGDSVGPSRTRKPEKEIVGSVATGQKVGAAAAPQDVIARATVHGIVTSAAVQFVGPATTKQLVVAATADQHIVAKPTPHNVIARATFEAVIAKVAFQRVVAFATVNQIVAEAIRLSIRMIEAE
ncbi:hypothetical protein [Phaeobacter sp. CAU 1743]|uniref:hypothetical protein n=1 Tax=Phaeobacter sp. CAU 1743 TaxID=3140367 RepID=UPI0023B3A899